MLLLAYSLAAPPPKHAEAPASSADPDREQRNHVIQTAEAGTIRNELGSVIYGADDHSVHIVLDLDAVHYDQVGITFHGPDNHGVTFGDMTSSVKVGHVEYETTFVLRSTISWSFGRNCRSVFSGKAGKGGSR